MFSKPQREDGERREQLLINVGQCSFRTICDINGTKFNLNISSGSSTNLACESLVTKLGLSLIEHPNPYKLHGLTDRDQIWVCKQVNICFSVRSCKDSYEDEILFDVIPMQEECILLGRPWQFDRRVIYDGYLNQYLFEMNGKPVILSSEAESGRCEIESSRKNEQYGEKM